MPQTKCMNPSVQLAGQYKRNTFWCNKSVPALQTQTCNHLCETKACNLQEANFFLQKGSRQKTPSPKQPINFLATSCSFRWTLPTSLVCIEFGHIIFICIIFIIQRQLRCIIFNQTSVMVCFSFVTTYLFIFYILNSIFQDIILLNGRILQLGFLTPSPSH